MTEKIEALRVIFNCIDILPYDFQPKDDTAFLFDKIKESHIPDNYPPLSPLHDIRFFELEKGTYSTFPLNWSRHPKTGHEWPMQFHKKIDLSPGQVWGDVKYVWELNRFQHFYLYGINRSTDDSNRYIDAAIQQIQNWIVSNPFLKGINWTSALEVSLRAISFLFARDQFKDSELWDKQFDETIQTSLYQHGYYLNQHLSFFISPYNHLIGEACGLFLIGSFFKTDKLAAKWAHKGLNILIDQIPAQFHPDGVSVEQSTSYQRFVLEFYFLAILRCRKLKIPFPDDGMHNLEAAILFLHSMLPPNGKMPMIGDNDSGRVFDFKDADFWDFGSLFSMAACIFKNPVFKDKSNGFDRACKTLLNEKDYKYFQEDIPDNCKTNECVFETGGYYLWRSNEQTDADFLLIDCGPIAAGLHENDIPSAAHGHADMLSIEFHHKGMPLFVDSGMLSYNESLEDHQSFRASCAHNTISVDNLSQTKPTGRMKWSMAREPECKEFISSPSFAYFSGEYKGFIHSGDTIRHQRGILFIHGHLMVIVDDINGEHNHDYQCHFNLPKEISPELYKSGVRLKPDAVLLSPSHEQWELSPSRRAIGYGVEEKGWRLTLSQQGSSNTQFITVLYFPNKTRSLSDEFISIGGECYQFQASQNNSNGVEVVCSRTPSEDQFNTDFDMCYYNRAPDDQIRMIGISGSELLVKQDLKFQSGKTITCCDMRLENGKININHPVQGNLNFDIHVNKMKIDDGLISQKEIVR
ncbi:MAG: heparinase II/III family protein [Desulfobacterales bacterium]|nr:heparinase II/III family protein [Desulfobacterales bacterium]